MKTFFKYAAVGLAGYLVGFYEMKYKILKAIVVNDVESKSKEEKEKGES